jgi:hypothetical protein
MRAILACLLALTLVSLAQAAVIHVPTDAPTLQAALTVAVGGDTVLVAAGTYAGVANAGLDFAGKNIVMIGEAGAEQTVIQGGQGGDFGMAFTAANGAGTIVDGFTLRGFYAHDMPPDEGAIVCRSGSAPVLRNLIVTDNYGSENYSVFPAGAGLLASGASPRVEDCLFQGNTTRYGGAVSITGGSPHFERVRFVGNEATLGGAVRVRLSSARFDHCSFESNLAHRDHGGEGAIAAGRGGAVHAEGAAVFAHCLFVDNRADSCRQYWDGTSLPGLGGALSAVGAVAVEGCTFSGNLAQASSLAPGEGGALRVEGSGLQLSASIIAGTSAEGPALFCAAGAAPATVDCNLFWDNPGGHTGGDCPDPVGADGNLEADPRFCDAAAGDFTLDADSPCLPAHNDCGLLIGAFDQGCGATAAETLPPTAGFALSSHPNPFNPSTSIRFTLSAAAAVSLAIHDLAGRRVATLLAGERREAGAQAVTWQGRLDAGGRATSGIYLARLAVGSRQETSKLVLLK